MSIYDTLNDRQKEAVFQTEGPLLILAGAGSGKTRVLTHRIAYLLEEKGVFPWNILAITFTNKAAMEMKERVEQLVPYDAKDIWVSTFHAACVRILRRNIERLGYNRNFTIYDTDDQKTVIKDICRSMNIDTKQLKERAIMSAISAAKNELITPSEYEKTAGDYIAKKIAEVYWAYDKQLCDNNALDFDDLLLKTVQLFVECPDVLERYQERFRYIMVDEYQDTNTVQFRFVSLLAAKYQNLCVVGDDDQSIYKFRGANIKNILNFEQEFLQAHVIKLEQNYRSTGTILQAANAVIKNNKGRKEKTLWTENPKGEKIHIRQFDSGYDEAEYIAAEIRNKVRSDGKSYHDFAVLYRTNAQSRLFEEMFVSRSIPYKLVGGVNFYGRKEIKDILAYLKTIDNGQDDLAVKRIINVPRRGIGLTTINRVQDSAIERGIGFYEALGGLDFIPGIGRSATKLESFVALIEYFKSRAEKVSLSELMDEILEMTAYIETLEAEGKDDSEDRIENINELISKVADYEKECEAKNEPATLSGFLEEVALVADIDSLEDGADYVVLMTLHGAKGLEFPYVYIAGMEDGLFPGFLSMESQEDMEEERRLCYVGITRAEKELTLSCAKRRMVRGETQYHRISRFLEEVPPELSETDGRRIESAAEKSVSPAPAYVQARQLFRQQPFAGVDKVKQSFTVTKGEGLSYGVGDRVRHIKFGDGTVLDITHGGRDYEVKVDFDTVGIKKMFAMFAKLKKI